MDGVEVEFLGAACDAHLVFVGTGLGEHTLVEVSLGIPYTFAEKFGKLGCMLGFLESVAAESLGDFGISFTIGLTRHREIHAYFATFAIEVGCEVGDHLSVGSLGNAYFVLGDELEFCVIVYFLEGTFGSMADRAFFGGFRTFVYITADCADKFLFHNKDD